VAEEISPNLSLTLKQQASGKHLYYLYAFFNSISWASLAEGVVILLLLRLGATETWVGIVASLQYVTLPVMVLGYATVARLGVSGTAGLFWGIRSCSAAFMIIAPWTQRFAGNMPLWFMLFGSLGFMLGRAASLVMMGLPVTQVLTYAFGILVAKQGYGLAHQLAHGIITRTLGGMAGGLALILGGWRTTDSCISRGDPQRGLLEASLKYQQKRFQHWFYNDTIKFLARLPDKVHREVAFFMAFLLLATDGFHTNSH
jgi:hypothetical protein